MIIKRKRCLRIILLCVATAILISSIFIYVNLKNAYHFDGDISYYFWLERYDTTNDFKKIVKIPKKDGRGHSVTGIGSYAIIESDKIEYIEIGDNIQWISSFGIACLPNLQSVYIGKNVSKISEGLFADCPLLTEVVIDSENLFFKSTGEAITSYDGKTLVRMWGKSEEIPATVESIGNVAFLNNDEIEKIVIPSAVKAIGKGAFENCDNLKYVYIPDSVEFIDNSVFWKCDKLEKIIIEEGAPVSDFSPTWNYLGVKDHGGEHVEVYIPYEIQPES